MDTADKKEDRKNWPLLAGLLSPLLMALIVLIPPISHLFKSISNLPNSDLSMALKAIWMAGIGTITIFYAPIKEKAAKFLFALFYAIIATSIGLLMSYVYAMTIYLTLAIIHAYLLPLIR